MKKRYLGAHVSAAGGLEKAIENGEKIGAEAIQIFGASPRQWAVRPVDNIQIEKFRAARAKSLIKRVYLHAPYLINLASPGQSLIQKSIANFTAHMQIAKDIDAEGVVVHVGSANGGDKNNGMEKAAKAMRQVLQNVPGKTALIMENAASTKKIGANIAELSFLFSAVNSSRLKICIDTAHALGAGLLKTFSKKEIADFFADFEKQIGLENLAVFHINDSKAPYASNRDLHENLGKGYIGLPAFKNLAENKSVKQIDCILEVPGFDGLGPDKKNVDILKRCFR